LSHCNPIVSMAQLDPVVSQEIPIIQKIIQDETWFEGERRGCFVSSDDPVVIEHVSEIVLRIGSEMRATLTAQVRSKAARGFSRTKRRHLGRY
jgi:hypothetical protein